MGVGDGSSVAVGMGVFVGADVGVEDGADVWIGTGVNVGADFWPNPQPVMGMTKNNIRIALNVASLPLFGDIFPPALSRAHPATTQESRITLRCLNSSLLVKVQWAALYYYAIPYHV